MKEYARHVAHLREQGVPWDEVAVLLVEAGYFPPGLTGDQLRKRYYRHVGRYGKLQSRAQADFLADKWIFTADRPRKHMVIPDTQIKPGERIDYLYWVGRYAAEKKPDVLVIIGDWYDMPSLSSYDKGKRSAENRRFKLDIEAGDKALDLLFEGMGDFRPELMVCTLGNHEYRIERFVEDQPHLEGLLGIESLGFEKYGIRVAPFLQPVEIDGVLYAHYVCRNAKGRVVQTTRGAPSAQAQVLRMGQSCTTGHAPGIDIAVLPGVRGLQRGLIVGSCLTPEHEVLTADLRYVPLGDVQEGDKLVAFDEDAAGSAGRSRRYKTGTVLRTRRSVREVMRVELDNGSVFHATPDHRWLVRTTGGTLYTWRTTAQLRVGTIIPRPLDHWSTLNDRRAGYLAGMYDGEGSLYARATQNGQYRVCQLSLSQRPGVVLDQCRQYLRELGLGSTSDVNSRGVATLRLNGGQANIGRLLGSIRPRRLLAKFRPDMLGSVRTTPNQRPRVVSVEPVGKREVVEIDIDAKTMVVEGYLHHNCYMHDEGYLSPQGNNYWRGIIVKNEVHDGDYSLMEVPLRYLERRYGQ